MVNKCAAVGCDVGYESCKRKVSTFSFPFKRPELLVKWNRFINRADNWVPGEHDVMCEEHFDPKFINCWKTKKTMNWKLFPVPTIHTERALERPSALPTTSTTRNPPVDRSYQPDEMDDFNDTDEIKSFTDINDSCCPTGYKCNFTDAHVVLYKLEFDSSGFPSITSAIKVDKNLHVQLECRNKKVPLPSWFVQGRNAKLNRFSILENFPPYLQSIFDKPPSLIDELLQRIHYKLPLPYSAEMIRFTLILRYTSAQAYKILLQKFPFPSMSLLKKLKSGNVDCMKATNVLRSRGGISDDVVLMLDEMYLQKSVQYHCGEYIGCDTTGNLYKGILVFMIQGLKKSIPLVIKACPETTINGQWLANEIMTCIESLAKNGFKVRAVVSDNHSSNVNAFNTLLEMHPAGDDCNGVALQHPCNSTKTYVFFDNVHLMKNIRNNLLNNKKFVFPPFDLSIKDKSITSDGGYIAWSDLHCIYDKDCKLDCNLRKAHKLTYSALHPCNNKQNVSLALAIFDETTIAASQCFLPNRPDVSSFLLLIKTWWTIANSKMKFSPNALGSAVVIGDGKMQFFNHLADWLESWDCKQFSLSRQTLKAFIRTLRAQAALVNELLAENYEFVILAKLQSDPLEKRFSQYRQMSGGRFLVSLREVIYSERILLCRSLLKEEIDFWEEDLQPIRTDSHFENIKNVVDLHFSEADNITLSSDSEEVAHTIAGYIALKLKKRSKCNDCKLKLISSDVSACPYFIALNRGGLTIPSEPLSKYVCYGFALLDYASDLMDANPTVPVRKCAEYILSVYSPDVSFTCSDHQIWGGKFAGKIMVNIFFNNKQQLQNDSIRKSEVVGFKKRQRTK